MNFRDLLHTIQEEVTSGDIATVDTKVGAKPLRHQGKTGKRCKKHKRIECMDCMGR